MLCLLQRRENIGPIWVRKQLWGKGICYADEEWKKKTQRIKEAVRIEKGAQVHLFFFFFLLLFSQDGQLPIAIGTDRINIITVGPGLAGWLFHYSFHWCYRGGSSFSGMPKIQLWKDQLPTQRIPWFFYPRREAFILAAILLHRVSDPIQSHQCKKEIQAYRHKFYTICKLWNKTACGCNTKHSSLL